MSVRIFALTYPQLMSQALHQDGAGQQGWSDPALTQLRHAYEYAEEWFDGFYRGQGQPFICHLVRTASIVLSEDQPIEVVAASLLHSAYLLGRFQNELLEKPTEKERTSLREAVGEDVEALIWDYHCFSWYRNENLDVHLTHLDRYDKGMRQLLLIRLANELEDHLDLAMAYRGTRSFLEEIEGYGPRCVALAKRLGQTRLAGELEEVFAAHREARISEALQTKKRFSYKWPGRVQRDEGLVKKVRRLVQTRFSF